MGCADDLVVSNLGVLGLNSDTSAASLLDLEPQDLTGLFRTASRGRVLPAEKTARYAAPLGIFGEERGEGFGIPTVERFSGRLKLIDHP